MIVWMQSMVANDNWFQLNLTRWPTQLELDRLIEYVRLSYVAAAAEVPLDVATEAEAREAKDG